MNSQRRTDLRNIAIIAHVDHGKTTLVDAMLKQGGMLGDRDKHGDRVMDSNALERERGITILAKNTAIRYGDITINILDTPGHHDFGGEVERMLKMADGVLLLVDAAEGPLPQTRFVLQKALDHRLAIITAINKIDRKDARPMEVLDEVYDLFIDMGATDDIIDFPVLFTEGREGRAHQSLDDGATDLRHLFDAIVAAVPAPLDTRHLPLRLQVNNLAWDDYVGRIAVGRVIDGTIRQGQSIVIKGDDHSARKGRIMRLYIANELGRAEIESAGSGDIISVAGLDPIAIGDTLCADESIEALPRIQV